MLARMHPLRTFRSSTLLLQATRNFASVNVPPTVALSATTLNRNVVRAEYAVRGELVIKADQYRVRIQGNPQGHGLPFEEVVFCNIGNPQELGQKPLTFPRQVLALMTWPHLLKDPAAARLFPADAVARATMYLNRIPAGTGAYSNSQGVIAVREEIANYISQRDGHACDPSDIFLTDGASSGVKMLLNMLIRDQKDGILIPIPQYPLYSATLTLCGGSQIGYYLNERNGWALELPELQKSLDAARSKGIAVRGLVVINPGNPTGQCLPEENIKQVVKFCQREKLVIMADEVYQANIYGSTPFTSFKKVIKDTGASDVPVVSFHSVSKGFLGECGRRGGYLELSGFDATVREQLYKMASISLCSNIDGQIMTGLMVNPPQPGDESFSLYQQERDNILGSLRRRAAKLVQALNSMEGISCQPVAGALYAFPSIQLSPRAVEAARRADKTPDTFYCLQLLDNTGICVVPGSGFGQRESTYHFRTTILPAEEKIDAVVKRMGDFHARFMQQYA